MTFTETKLRGAYVIEPERFDDERGFFARTFCRREFEEHGLDTDVAQSALSYNRRKGTLRGMHYQAPPHAQAKLVRSARGAVYDVIIDLRPESATLRSWFGMELTAANRLMLYVPKGFAHGFLTLDDDSEVAYHMSGFYAPETERGVRWDDPAFGIQWPIPVTVLSERDRAFPPFRPPDHGR